MIKAEQIKNNKQGIFGESYLKSYVKYGYFKDPAGYDTLYVKLDSHAFVVKRIFGIDKLVTWIDNNVNDIIPLGEY